jgi:phage recombination protein Bet
MSTDLTTRAGQPAAEISLSREQIDLLKRTIFAGSTDDEFALLLQASQRLGLDPFNKQLYGVKRWDSKQRREVMALQVGIDGFRIVAERSGRYAGQEGTWYAGTDGQWVEIWNRPEPPVAAKCVVLKQGPAGTVRVPAVAHWSEYVATTRDGTPNQFWRTKPAIMLGKCAEALALRKAFPQELSGFYTPDEMGQASNGMAPPPAGPPPVEPKDDREVVQALRDAMRQHGVKPDALGALLDAARVPRVEPLRKRIAMADDLALTGVIAEIEAAHQVHDAEVVDDPDASAFVAENQALDAALGAPEQGVHQ